ncbi:MAG TPA: His/Gly/Thr/Pro-type tRNA ligase C-terminal domain-containing protein, partial [Candidatus Saccharimonadales bacterium]|nr:His/Gly/Thr/Pro-type tRNA ligase C-terminal domain-containing protein [Candidatus Saccharimonadales bacterium]
YYERAIVAYNNIFNRFGIGEKTYLTYASGGSFSKYSHEFQTLTSAGEDIIYVCDDCRMAINKEIIADQNTCPKCGKANLREDKAVEVGNIFKLGTKYSEPFDLKYQDKNGEKKLVIMGCYGLGLSRALGTIVEICHDEKGIIWPEAVAPFKIHLLSLGKNDQADKIYEDLKKAGVEVLYDDRDVSAGEKFADADLIGCPYRLVLSKKSLENGGLELKRRNEKDASIIALTEILNKII